MRELHRSANLEIAFHISFVVNGVVVFALLYGIVLARLVLSYSFRR
jgi:hypothetical protein